MKLIGPDNSITNIMLFVLTFKQQKNVQCCAFRELRSSTSYEEMCNEDTDWWLVELPMWLTDGFFGHFLWKVEGTVCIHVNLRAATVHSN